MIVIDACNVAMNHGKNYFSSHGIQIVIEYWREKGHQVIAFLPQYFMKNRNPEKLADDTSLLQFYVDNGLLILTPPQDKDDSYVIKYAQDHNAFIITNDMYRDYGEIPKDWFKEHCCSFTFVNDEFFPNPDFKFP